MLLSGRIYCVGDLMVDVLAHLPGALAIGSDTPAQITQSGGGSAANTAAWLAAAGVAVTFVGRVGDDALGRAAVDELVAASVELAVSVDPALPTGTCIVLVDPSGERTMIPSAGANAAGAAVPALSQQDHLHVSGYALFHPESCAAALSAIATARSAGATVSVDAASAAPLATFGPDQFLDAIGQVMLFANRDEAMVLTERADVEVAVRVLATRCGEAVVKQGAAGAAWSDGGRVVSVRPEPIAPRDTTGAGDAFAAGVLAARHVGLPVREALRAGNELAARAVTVRGARP